LKVLNKKDHIFVGALETSVENISVEAKPVPAQEDTLGEVTGKPTRRSRHQLKEKLRRYWLLFALITYLLGVGSGFFARSFMPDGARATETDSADHSNMTVHMDQINPPDGVELPVKFSDIGPTLLAAGAIDYPQFVKLYQESGRPLNDQQRDILIDGSDAPVIINKNNAHFLLNLFWALGLTNQNKILTEGPMMQKGKENVVNFASTGGWTLARRPIGKLYASEAIISLTKEQQKRVEEVAQSVFRPCCDNPTHFPDCNHGMAMLGLLELMASQGATVEQMFEAARWVNAYWFPQQSFELAVVIKAIKNLDFAKADARAIVGQQLASSSGFQAVHQWLAQNGQLEEGSGGGASCGVK
jgi:hypothetical protein